MEGGIHAGGTDASAFRECFSLTWKNPYVLRLAFSAGIGGLLFGYDTGSAPLFPCKHLDSPHIIEGVYSDGYLVLLCVGFEQGLYQELSCT